MSTHLPRRVATALLACFLFACFPLAAQTPQAEAALVRFRAAAGGDWICTWNQPTGTPRELFGTGMALTDWRSNSLDEARRHALATLREWPDLLGLGECEYREILGSRLGRSWSFTFVQHHAGLEVVGGRVDVRIHGVGKLAFVGSTAWPIPSEFATVPTLGEDEAVRLGWSLAGCEPNQVPQPGRPRAPRLVILGDDSLTAVRLAWEVPYSAVLADGTGPIGRVYVDAHLGTALRFVNDKHECGFCSEPPQNPPAVYTVMGYAHDGTSPVAAPNNVPLPGLQVSIPGIGLVTTDANGQFTANLTTAASVLAELDGIRSGKIVGSQAPTVTATLQPGIGGTLQFAAANSGEQPLAHTTTYLWTYRVNEYLRGILGNSAQLAYADSFVPTVNIASTCNAYYTGASINFYRAGGGCNNTASASVIAHEWGHGLDDMYGGINQGNGLSEGWGDIHSVYLLDDPVIGHGFYTSGSGIRNANNTRQYPTGNGVHAQGESWMGFAWKLRNNLRTTIGNAQAIAVSNDIVLGSIVANATDQQSAVREVFVADDDDGNLLNGVPHYNELVAACNVHNLPYPSRQDGYITHTQLQPTRNAFEPRQVDIQAVPTFGAWQQVRLHYDDGQPRVRAMVGNGQANGYRALLPGAAPGQIIAYHFEALHASGNVIRLPLAGDYSYVTVTEDRFYHEDFETGAPGWTHGAQFGNDDWQIGAPQGRTGAGWTDPAAAAQGVRCAGTDLGLNGGDGAYSPNSSMWLRSPPIDCTGRTGVRLRFARWLTCDSGLTDILMVRINGAIAWINPLTPTIDGAWRTIEVAANSADNNPATVVEFSLRSDAQFHYGGWQIDDVELFTVGGTYVPPIRLQMLPEQVAQNGTVTISVTTPGSRPFGLAFSDSAGPLQLQGLPPLAVGGNYTALFGMTNAAGTYTSSFAAPTPAGALGLVWHSQVLTLDGNFAFATSNKFRNLFTL